MKLKLLKEDFEIKPFDCGDTDLNGFLTEDAKAFYEKNDFRFLDAEDKNKHTRLMYFDMLEM